MSDYYYYNIEYEIVRSMDRYSDSEIDALLLKAVDVNEINGTD